MTLNRHVFHRDPTTFTIPNDGVAEVFDPQTDTQWAVLRYELESFVCRGEYAAGMERILSTFLRHLDQPKQPAVWVSGFYGSGKSHLVRVLQYLWQDVIFPDGAQARGLVHLPTDVRELFIELATAGRRAGGLWSAAGTLSAGDGNIRLALLAILFRGAGLPGQYAPARFVLWLHRTGVYDAVRAHLQAAGTSLEGELNDMYVSPILARAVLEAYPDLATTPKEVLASLRAQFPQRDQIGEDEMLQAMDEVLALRASRRGAYPLTLLVLDELQQSIGQDADRTLQVQDTVEACCSRFGSQLLVVGTGQSALEADTYLSKLRDRFTVRVTLSDTDVQQVVREVVLRKSPEQVDALRLVLEEVSGEINRHLQGTKIAHTSADDEALVPDYPLLPTRLRFWERVLRAIDRPGTAAQLRTQLRTVHEANGAVADKPIGTVVSADMIYRQQESSMLQSGVLLPEVARQIAAQDDGTPDGDLRARLCAVILLIGELPTEGGTASGVRATSDMLADLLVEDLRVGSASLRQRIPALLQQLVDDGLLMQVEGEYRLQTRESAEWERDRRSRYQRIANDEVRLAGDRVAEFRSAVTKALKDVKLLHGASKTPRRYLLHFGEDAPATDTDAVPVWVRDAWSASEKAVQDEALRAGPEDPTVFVLLPRRDAEALRDALAGLAAATETLAARPARQTTPEGINARRSMETRRDIERSRVDALVEGVLAGARVYQGGGNEVAEGSLMDSVETALHASLVRLFPKYDMADDPAWKTVVSRAHQNIPDALSALGYEGAPELQPVCREVLAYLGNDGKSGSEVRKHFAGAGYGWPQDAVDGALLALLIAGQIEALTKDSVSVTPKQIPQSQIGVITYRSCTTVVTASHRIALRKLAQDLGVPIRNGEEAQVVPVIVQRLSDLAAEVGGQPPLPAAPHTDLLDELQAKGGNEQVVAVYEKRAELLQLHDSWQRAKAMAAKRLPRWERLRRLLAHAVDLPVATTVRAQKDAILAGRSLLSDPDPVQPLLDDVTGALRAALQSARQRLIKARERELEALEDTLEWTQLSDAAWEGILQAQGVGPVQELEIGTEEALLATLDATPLRTWEDWVVAIPSRIARAREHAAKTLEPEAERVTLKSATLRTVEEVDAYLAEARVELVRHVEAGHPVIV